MANRNETIIIDVQVTDVKQQLGETAKAINDLKEQNKALKKEQKDGTADWASSTATIKQNEAQIKLLTAAEKSLEGQLRAATTENKKYGNSNVELRAQVADLERQYNALTEAQKNTAEGKALLKQQNDLKAAVKGNAEELGNFQDSVGNYEKSTGPLAKTFEKLKGQSDAMTAGFSGFISGIKGAGSPLGLFKKGIDSTGISMDALSKNPIIAILSVLIGLFNAVKDSISGSSKATNTLKQAMAPVNALMTVLKNGTVALLQVFLDAFLAVSKFTVALASLVTGNDKYTKSVKDAIKVEQERQAIAKKNRELIVEEAKGNLEVAKLRDKVTEKDKYTRQQREQFLREAIAIERKMADDKIVLAREEYNNLVKTLRSKEEINGEEKNKLAEAKAKLYNVESEYYSSVRRMKTQAATFNLAEDAAENERQQQAVENQKKANEQKIKNAEDAEKARIDAINKYVQAELNRINEVAINAENKRLEALKKVQEAEDLLKAQNETLRGLATENADIELQAFNDLQFAKRVLADGNISEMARLDREALKAEYDAKIANAQAAGRDTAAIEASFSEEKKRINQAENDAKLDIASQTMGSLSTIFGEGTKAGKEFAAAQVAIDTYKGALSAFTSMASIPFVGPVLGGIAAAGVVAKGVKSIKDIYAVKKGQTSVSAQAATPAISASSVSTPATKGADLVLNSSQAGSLNNKIAAGQPQSGGLDYDLLAKSMSKQPAPVMVYSEFKTFEGKVTNFDEQTKI